MTKIQKYVVAVIALIAIVALFTLSGKSISTKIVGGTTNYDTLSLDGSSDGNYVTSFLAMSGITWTTVKDIAVTQASTTLCAIQSPTATSTLVAAGIRLDVATSSAYFIEMAQATTAFATTTLIGTKYSVAAGQGIALAASSTPGAAASLFSPSTWFVVKWAPANSAIGAQDVPTGICDATWKSI